MKRADILELTTLLYENIIDFEKGEISEMELASYIEAIADSFEKKLGFAYGTIRAEVMRDLQ